MFRKPNLTYALLCTDTKAGDRSRLLIGILSDRWGAVHFLNESNILYIAAA